MFKNHFLVILAYTMLFRGRAASIMVHGSVLTSGQCHHFLIIQISNILYKCQVLTQLLIYHVMELAL